MKGLFGIVEGFAARVWRLRAAGALVASALLAASCGGPGGHSLPSSGDTGAIAQNPGAVKVALLLPTSGSGTASAVAKALRQAGEMALFDFNNPNVTLIPKDTQGTPQGAREAELSGRLEEKT